MGSEELNVLKDQASQLENNVAKLNELIKDYGDNLATAQQAAKSLAKLAIEQEKVSRDLTMLITKLEKLDAVTIGERMDSLDDKLKSIDEKIDYVFRWRLRNYK